MNLNVRKKNPSIRRLTTGRSAEVAQPPQMEQTQPPSLGRQPTDNGYHESISIRCNALLYHTIQHRLTAAHTVADFTYVSVADVIRAALQAYQNGMPLTELDKKGETKISTTIRVDSTLKAFYRSLPDRLRSQIVERAIRTFLTQ